MFGAGFALLVRRLWKTVLDEIETTAKPEAAKLGSLAAEAVLLPLTLARYMRDTRALRHRTAMESRDFITSGVKTQAPIVPDLSDAFVEPFVGAARAGSRREPPRSIWAVLEGGYHIVVVLGPAGSGKSTLCKNIALRISRQSIWRRGRPHWRRLLPRWLLRRQRALNHRAPRRALRIPVRDLDLSSFDANREGLDKVVSSYFNLKLSRNVERSVRRWLRSWHTVVLLDGLDEIAHRATRKAFSQWLNDETVRWPKVTFVVTSRPATYAEAPVEYAQATLEMSPFNESQQQQFISQWYEASERRRRDGRFDDAVRDLADRRAKDLWQRLSQEAISIRELAATPLLLTMIVLVHDYRGALPGRRVDLYSEVCEVMLERRRSAKGLMPLLGMSHSMPVLQSLALDRFSAGESIFWQDAVTELINDSLARVGVEHIDAERFLQFIEAESGLMIQTETDRYQFAHLSIQEYLSAGELRRIGDEDRVLDLLEDARWGEVLRQFVALPGDASWLVDKAIDRSTTSSLRFAIECVADGSTVPLSSITRLRPALDQLWKASEPRENLADLAIGERLCRSQHVGRSLSDQVSALDVAGTPADRLLSPAGHLEWLGAGEAKAILDHLNAVGDRWRARSGLAGQFVLPDLSDLDRIVGDLGPGPWWVLEPAQQPTLRGGDVLRDAEADIVHEAAIQSGIQITLEGARMIGLATQARLYANRELLILQSAALARRGLPGRGIEVHPRLSQAIVSARRRFGAVIDRIPIDQVAADAVAKLLGLPPDLEEPAVRRPQKFHTLGPVSMNVIDTAVSHLVELSQRLKRLNEADRSEIAAAIDIERFTLACLSVGLRRAGMTDHVERMCVAVEQPTVGV